MLLGFTYLLWNNVKTAKAPFSTFLNTSSTFAPQAKGRIVHLKTSNIVPRETKQQVDLSFAD